MSEEIKYRVDQKRINEQFAEMIQGEQTKDGHRVFRSPDGKRSGTIPRTISDKLNFTYLLQKQIDNCNFVGMYSYEAFARSVIILLQMIPEEDQDETFKEKITKATFKVRIPTGRYGGGGGRVYEICQETREYDHLKIFRAIIDLLRRRGLFESPKLWSETQNEIFWSKAGEKEPVTNKKQRKVK